MITQQEDRELARCRRLIEEKMGWGRSDGWSTQDFERLSEQIAGQTGISLSVTTLKRVWGRVRYESAPTATTLNALVQFAGYENWSHFKAVTEQDFSPKKQSEPDSIAVPEPVGELPATTLKPVQERLIAGRNRLWVGLGLLASVVGVLAFFLSNATPKPLSPTDFSFSSQPVAKGLPNSVVFSYDATASPTDSVFIQQSWDPRRRDLVPKNGHEYTSIYYSPGYYRAKLVIGKQIVKQHNLLIPSDGWHVAVLWTPVPIYFKSDDITRKGVLGLSVEDIKKRNIPVQPQPPTVLYRYVREFDRLNAKNFIFETRVRNDFEKGSSACQYIRIMVLCKNQYFSIPLSAKGCIGNLDLYLAGHQAEAKTKDLSNFGADLSKWVDVRCEVRNKRVLLFVAGKKAYEAIAPNAFTDIVGVSYEFEGTGSVDFVRFKRPDGTIAFEDNFDAH
ncbi:hypothetical protein EXU85_17270 [Spirosoma sp. KCTC 42546]|uniref:hypothetical protein n=1 Tax=Spirosoma sp. KCTC 42546 TaxID=2520506 RepID=UPI001158AA1F|nr:hypothetical protein [Spirosoma sp. KCTC 42546]QDK80257.1 hypothetical protein EXU85_17270 [Spirosoma sp. KCTC 42546]